MKQFIYLIAIRSGALSVVVNNGSLSLPGGACSEQENHEEYLTKICLEETGFDIQVEDLVCEQRADGGTEYYYSGALQEEVTQPKNALQSLPLTQLNRLPFPRQVRAVEECLAVMRADAHGSDDENL